MTADPLPQQDFHVLTPEAFDFVLNNELKRAVRSQHFLTLLLVEPWIQGVPRGANGERDRVVRQIAGLISRELRETDLLSQTDSGRLSIVLLDADLPNSLRVVDRLMTRLKHYEFTRPIDIEVGAACCPTHGTDPESLVRAAAAHPVDLSRGSRGDASNAP